MWSNISQLRHSTSPCGRLIARHHGQKSSLFCFFHSMWPSCELMFPGRQQFVVSVAVAVPLISSPRPRNEVLNEQHWCFRKQFLIVGVKWLSYCRSQPLLSLGSSLSNDSAVLHTAQLDPGERFPWLGEGTTSVFQSGVWDMLKLWHTFGNILWTLFLERQIRGKCITNTRTIRQT